MYIKSLKNCILYIETNYKCEITNFNNIQKTLRMKLYNDNAFVEVSVYNYGEDDVTIEYNRDYNNQNEKILQEF